ncbi:hypothetical protein SBDP1_90001 [Syntrophobacter sp. SbD1]|nr:hypothetical protein SBDP1_90001 [Syntrophobacter sp. SbD1]
MGPVFSVMTAHELRAGGEIGYFIMEIALSFEVAGSPDEKCAFKPFSNGSGPAGLPHFP